MRREGEGELENQCPSTLTLILTFTLTLTHTHPHPTSPSPRSRVQHHQRQNHINTHRREASVTHDPASLRAHHRHKARGHRKILCGSPTGNRSSPRQEHHLHNR